MSSVWRADPEVLVTDLGDELVLLDARTGEMFNLNASGRAVWLALPCTLDTAALLLGEQGAPADAAQGDALALLQGLADAGLVRPPA